MAHKRDYKERCKRDAYCVVRQTQLRAADPDKPRDFDENLFGEFMAVVMEPCFYCGHDPLCYTEVGTCFHAPHLPLVQTIYSELCMNDMVMHAEKPRWCSSEHPGQGGQKQGVCPGEHGDRLLHL